MKNRVVVTGLGAITPMGHDFLSFREGIKKGRSGIRKLSLVSDPLLTSQVAAEVPDFDASKYIDALDLKRVPRVVPMTIGAVREALKDARIDLEEKDKSLKENLGLVLGTGGGGIEFAEKQYEQFFANNSRHVTPYCVSSSFVGMLSSEVSIALGLHGLSHVISTGCTSSTDALGYAYHMIRSGDEEILLSGGAESCITPGIMAGFCRMKVVSSHFNDEPSRASRPFDRDRDGFVLGEGAWMFVMESYEHAKKRGAKIMAEILGYGSTCDAYHRVAAKSDGIEPARAMKKAIDQSGIDIKKIRCVNLHGTGTKLNDSVETKAVKLVFGNEAAHISNTALKSMIGHPQGACGAAGVMSGIMTLEDQFVPPTINYDNPDPECDLDYTPNHGVEMQTDYVLCNTIAFGSKNSAILIGKP